jgi:hypothetical protein
VIFRKYGELPTTYAAGVGAVVDARRSMAEPFTRAVVIGVRRLRDSASGRVIVEYKIVWMADNDEAGPPGRPVREGEVAWVKAIPNGEPELLRQVRRAA